MERTLFSAARSSRPMEQLGPSRGSQGIVCGIQGENGLDTGDLPNSDRCSDWLGSASLHEKAPCRGFPGFDDRGRISARSLVTEGFPTDRVMGGSVCISAHLYNGI